MMIDQFDINMKKESTSYYTVHIKMFQGIIYQKVED